MTKYRAIELIEFEIKRRKAQADLLLDGGSNRMVRAMIELAEALEMAREALEQDARKTDDPG